MPLTILMTGFGPFPGAPFNPTASLVRSLARQRRPALAGVQLAAHVFATSYAAVDRELPALIARYKPHALLMFGLAPRAKLLRVETRAQNSRSRMADVSGAGPRTFEIAHRGARDKALPAPARRLVAAVRSTRVKVTLSRDAGRYLCNYLCWHAVEATQKPAGPRLAAFIHVPPVPRHPLPLRLPKKHRLAQADLRRAGVALLCALVSASR
jgi:pyroglutamyl-peptidase